MSHFHESIPVLCKVEKTLSYMLKSRYKRQQGRDLQILLSMELLWFLQTALWWCRRSRAAPWASQQLQEQKAVVGLPLALISLVPQHRHSSVSGRADLPYVMVTECTYAQWLFLQQGNPGLAVTVVKLLAPFYLHFSKRKNPFMR